MLRNKKTLKSLYDPQIIFRELRANVGEILGKFGRHFICRGFCGNY